MDNPARSACALGALRGLGYIFLICRGSLIHIVWFFSGLALTTSPPVVDVSSTAGGSGRQALAAAIFRFRSRPDALTADQVARVRGELVELLERPDVPRRSRERLVKVVGILDAETASREPGSFLMLFPSQNALVVNHLAASSRRPVLALRLWALCFEHLRHDTGEILLSREEIAEKLGILPRHVSELVGELVAFGALSRLRDGRGVRYFLNPRVGTHLARSAREEAQKSAPKLALVGVADRPGERRRRAVIPALQVL